MSGCGFVEMKRQSFPISNDKKTFNNEIHVYHIFAYSILSLGIGANTRMLRLLLNFLHNYMHAEFEIER